MTSNLKMSLIFLHPTSVRLTLLLISDVTFKHSNELTGSIPPEISALTSMTYLYLVT